MSAPALRGDSRTTSAADEKLRGLTYQPAFDGLRAVAVCTVAMYHVDKTLLPGGWAGVDVFFVLSGYLITRILIRELRLDNGISFRNFYMRRILRLVPAFWCLLAFVTATAPFRSHPRQVLEAVAASGTYLINWTRAFQLGSPDILGHTWSLAIEEQFYLVWPLLLLCIWNRRPARWLGALIVAVLVWRSFLVAHGANVVRVYTGFDTHSDGLLLGCLLAFVPLRGTWVTWAARTSALPLVLLAAIVASCSLQNDLVQSFGLLVVAGLSVWLIVAVQAPGVLQACLSQPVLTYTGRISYGFYLWHYPLIALVNERFGLKGSLLAVAFSYGLAAVSYQTIETRFLSYKFRFPRNERDAARPPRLRQEAA